MTETDPPRGDAAAAADHEDEDGRRGLDDVDKFDDDDEGDDDDLRTLFSSGGTATPSSDTLRSNLRRNLFGEVPIATQIGRYVIQEHVGSGGMGAVYLAHDSKLRRSVALKLLHRGSGRPGSLERRRRRLLREAHGLARLSHPNVVQVHDVDTHGEHLFLVMDYVEGRTLKQWIEAEARGWREILEVFRQAGEGIAAAHSAGLIHRDIKPSNILIRDDGRVMVIDFGLVRVGELSTSSEGHDSITEDDDLGAEVGVRGSGEPGSEDDLTAPGAVIGTLAYIPPETFSGAPADARSDVYSLCVSLYEALYGSRPYQAETRDLLICQIIEGKRPTPPPGRAIPRWLTEVCLRGLAPDPAQRPASMVEFLAELSPRSSLRRRLLPLVAGLVGAAVAAMAVFAAITPAETTACGAEPEVPVFWSISDQAAMRGALAVGSLRDPAAVWGDVDGIFGAHAAAQGEVRTEICGADPGPEAAASQRCLATVAEDHRRALTRIIRGDASALIGVLEDPGSLLSPTVCAEPAMISGLVASSGTVAGSSGQGAGDRGPEGGVSVALAAVDQELARGERLVEDGRYREALAALSTAQTAAEEVGSAGQEARAWYLRGWVESLLADPASVESLAMAQMLAAQVGDDALLNDAILDRARVLVGTRGAPKEAEPWARRAERRFEQRGLGRVDAAQLHQVLAEIALAKAELTVARGHLEVCRELRERSLGDAHPLVAEATSNLAAVADLQGDDDLALGLYRQALALREENLRPGHPAIAATLTGLAGVLARRGEVEESEAAYARALAIDRSVFGDSHPRVATILHNLGVAARQRGELERAQELYAEALEIRREHLGREHPQVADTLNAMAIVDKRLGDEDRALGRYLLALEIRERQLGDSHPRVASTLGSLANLHVAREEYSQALPLLRRAGEIYRAQGASGEVDLVWILRLTGKAELRRGRVHAAIPMLKEAERVAESTLEAGVGYEKELGAIQALLEEAEAAAGGRTGS